MITNDLLQAIIAIVKNKPGKEELTPEDLNETIERIAVRVSRYCRLKVLPYELKYTLADIVSETYDMLHPVVPAEGEEADDFDNRVKSIKQGDTTIELAVTAEIIYKNVSEVIKKYAQDLAPYKGVFWR